MQLARLSAISAILSFSFGDVCYALRQPHWRLREQLVAPEDGATLPNDPRFIQVRGIFYITRSVLDLACVYQIPIDHFGTTNNTDSFANRFWVNDTYYESGGPIFRT